MTQQEDNERGAREAAYRRGFLHGVEEASRLVLQLRELGYTPTEIRRLLAVYDDHFLQPWRQFGDLSKREAPPPFRLDECLGLLQKTTGYDWIV